MKLKFPWQKFQMIRACKELADMQLWESYENLFFFVVKTPLEDHVVVSIMGAGGQEYGINVFRGPDAFKQPIMLTNDERASADKLNTIGFSMVHYRDMQYEEKKWLKSCNYRAKKSDWLPSVISKRPGEMMQMVEKDHDISLMLYVVKGIIQAQQDGEFCPVVNNSGSKIFTIEVCGHVSEPDVKVTHKSFPGSKELLQMCRDEMADDPSELPDISRLPRLEETWVVVPVYVTNENNGNDKCILAIAEEESHYILHADVIPMDTSLALDVLFGVFSGDNAIESIGVPEKIIIAEKTLFDAVKDIQKLGINVCYKKKHPVAKDIRESIANDLPAFAKKHFAEALEIPDIDPSVVPADDDLQNWKLVQKVLTNQFINFWHDSDYLHMTRPSKKFFGDDDWEYYIDEYDEMAALPTYVTWAALTYRTAKNKPTYAEKLLAEALGESLRISLESLNNSYPSLYQIAETNAETGYIVLKDLLLYKTITVHDQGLSETARSGWIAPFWVYPIGDFHFVDIAGPMFNALNSTDVMDELLELKLPTKPTPGWLRENAYIFGRLWALYDEIAESSSIPPKLTNTDGQPLEFITAYFECAGPKSARKALSQRDNVDYDEDEDVYIWFKDNPDDPVMETTLLARIFVQDNKIKTETNSKGRLDCLIDMLEAVDGVSYLEHESKGVEEMLEEAREKKQDVAEEPLPEEVKAAVQDRMREYYMDWLDKPNPALGNKTPRQAARNKKTSQKTRILIETIPAPASSNDIKIPKKEMLRNIGFDEN
ncbi:MAG: hypothetical protein RQ760_21610 [Sedimentisphaerales bacterium]|nr:hypothetical protein [Sedimentisphaerales bacterium]